MKAKLIRYGRLKTQPFSYNNEKVEIELEIEEGEKAEDVLQQAKQFVKRAFGENQEELPF